MSYDSAVTVAHAVPSASLAELRWCVPSCQRSEWIVRPSRFHHSPQGGHYYATGCQPVQSTSATFSQNGICFAGYQAERNAKGFTCWTQFVAMEFCQLAHADSLREICNGLACSEGKLVHLGITSAPNKSTLSYANEHRPAALFEDLFY